ncbi:HPF/RaiA family ribosome-associated protein [uncultured Flavobacterium sp.]|uniref:HPF/RaiA family ribosome-associated protein n=1 Tax=uncultured Flavobacterium sp. TaxID=165435 RepID=UPI0030ECD04B|tara:strand:+ start:1458 stop:1772 length:315 start_codon:yes stop_codon:yes gene_type:complete
MKILFNTDKTISGDENQEDYFTSLIAEKLERFQSQLTRIEVHLKDENGKKEGLNDIHCVLEARIEGREPMAVSCEADTAKNAVSGAIDKLKTALDTVLGRLKNH